MAITTKFKGYEKKIFSLLVKLIYTVNFLIGTIPIFQKKYKKIRVVNKKFRQLYASLLLTITILCLCLNKQVVMKFSGFKNGFNLNFILETTSVISTILSISLCWIGSLKLSKYQMKIIYNNLKINELLIKKIGKKRIPFFNESIFVSIIFVSTNFASGVYFSFSYLKMFNFTDLWFHLIIFIFDWFAITYLMQQKLNIHNFKVINIELNSMLKTNSSPSLNIHTIMIVFEKNYENNIFSKYIISYPVNIYIDTFKIKNI